jgi:ubiquitin carboxyl-terminal hydrolase 8
MNMNTLVQKKTDQSIKIEKKESPNGISNIGNSCYMNAAFQTIVHIFGDFFIKGEYNKKLSQNQYITDFVKDFAHLMAAIQNDNGKWKKDHVSFYLRNIIKYLSKIKDFNKFTKYKKQCDSHDFLISILDILSEYLKSKISIEIYVKVDEKDLDEKDKIRLIFYKYLQSGLKHNSIFDERLRGYFRASITCAYEDCNYSSEKFEPFFTLSLPIDGKDTLEECLEEYVKPYILDAENQWMCNKCKRKSQAIKKFSIWNTSDYIIISYKRYFNMMNTTLKNNTRIIAPFSNLDMSPYIEDNNVNENMYNLCSVTIHSGNMSTGHYITARKIEKSWFIFNDNCVIPVNKSDVDISNAYYLVYKRN